jgi:hypothetical protein
MTYVEHMTRELLQRFPREDSPPTVFTENDPVRTRMILHHAAPRAKMEIKTSIVNGQLTVWRVDSLARTLNVAKANLRGLTMGQQLLAIPDALVADHGPARAAMMLRDMAQTVERGAL